LWVSVVEESWSFFKIKIVSGLLPSLNRKLRGKEYSSLSHGFEAVQVEEWRLEEAERCTHGRLGATEATLERKGAEQRAIVDKVASRKRASQRARAGKPWRGLKAKGLT